MKNKFEDGNGIQNVDVFVVREGSGRQATDYSIGGISKPMGKITKIM